MSASVHSAGPPGLARKGKIPPGLQGRTDSLRDGHPIKALAASIKAKEEEAAKASTSSTTPEVKPLEPAATIEASVSVSGSSLDTLA